MKRRVSQWLEFADEDYRMAQLAMEEKIYNQVCFHAQQCVEKSLKALIEARQKVPKIHKLDDILELCLRLGYMLEQYQNDIEFIDKFYTSTRYPFIVGMLPGGLPVKQDAEKALQIADTISNLVKKQLERFG
jgi:HEPN domain-containing protein